MSVPVLTFFNNKGGVGKTSLVYHLAWMYAELGVRVVAGDLDPQANLTSMFLPDDLLETYWLQSRPGKTIYGALQPLLDGTGDVDSPYLARPSDALALVVGDLKLSSAEGELSSQWPACLDRQPRAFRVISALWRVLQMAAEDSKADVVLVDVGPNLGALNRAVLVATDYVVVPLAADLYSLQGLRNLGPTLESWRSEWKDRSNRNPVSDLPMPIGSMSPIGYVVQQHGVRLGRPVQAYDKWINRMPKEYAVNLLGKGIGPYPRTPDEDDNALATVKHYRSLVPMAQEARKPIFKLAPADGARGAHATAAQEAQTDFRVLAQKIKDRWFEQGC